MSYFHLTRSRTRELTPEYDNRSLVRLEPRKPRRIVLTDDEDDGADDYPYSPRHRPARALTLRNRPSELERYNIWADRHEGKDNDVKRRSFEDVRTIKYTSPHRHHHHALSDEEEERTFRLKFQASFPRSRSAHQHSHRGAETHAWPSTTFHREEKWVNEDWETRERSTSREKRRRDSLWCEEEDDKDEEKEKWSRYRRIESTKTEDVYRPLSRWRRNRIVFES